MVLAKLRMQEQVCEDPENKVKIVRPAIHAPTAISKPIEKLMLAPVLSKTRSICSGGCVRLAAFRHHFPKEGAQTQLVRRIVLRSSAENGGEFDERQFVVFQKIDKRVHCP